MNNQKQEELISQLKFQIERLAERVERLERQMSAKADKGTYDKSTYWENWEGR